MVLDSIINKLQWTPYGIACTDTATTRIVHKFLREAILDRHIYVHKIIGFAVNSTKEFRPYSGVYIARHKQLGESYPEIMVNLQDKVFINTLGDSLDTVLVTGENNVIDQPFGDMRDYKAEVLYTNPYICRCLDKETIFRVRIQYDCGFKSMADNTKSLEDQFFPCYTDYSLSDYLRVLPMEPGATLVPIRYYHGITEAQFKDILTAWYVYVQTGSLKEEETLWMRSFML